MKNIKSFLLLSLLILLIFSFQSCSDDSVNNGVNNPNVVTSLNGSVSFLPSNARIVKGLVARDSISFEAAIDTIGSDSLMYISLKTPPQNALYSLNEILSQLVPGIIYIGSIAKGNFLNLSVYNTTTGQLNGSLVKANSAYYIIPQEGSFYLNYIYSDGNATISGTTVNVFNNDTLKYIFTLDLGAGYNRVTTRIKTHRTNFTEFEIFSGEPAGANWYYIPNVSDLFKN